MKRNEKTKAMRSQISKLVEEYAAIAHKRDVGIFSAKDSHFPWRVWCKINND